VDNVNEGPTALSISPLTVAENSAGVVIGVVSVSDPDAGETFTYQVSDSRFTVLAGELRLQPGVALDFETTPSIAIDVTAFDSGGLSISRPFTIGVANINEAPTAISAALSPVPESTAGAILGTLSATDPDSNPPFTFTVADPRFEVVGSQLKLKTGQSLDYEAGASVSVNVTARDSGGLAFTQAVTVSVVNVAEAPTDVRLSREKVFNNIAGAWVATVSVSDSDATNAHTFVLSDARFEVRGGNLYLKAGQTISATAGQTIPLHIDVQDAAAGASFGKDFNLLVETGPSNWNFAGQWKPNRLDVNVDGVVSPLDALLVIIELNAVGPRRLAPTPGGTLAPLFLDTSGDDSITPLDALEVIIYLNSGSGGEAEVASAVDAAFSDDDSGALDPWFSAWWEATQDDEARRSRGA
jgi:hypothetical protein